MNKNLLVLLLLSLFSQAGFASCPVEMEYNKLVDCIVSEGASSEGLSVAQMAANDEAEEQEPLVLELRQCPTEMEFSKLVDCIVSEGAEEDGHEPEHLAEQEELKRYDKSVAKQ